MGDEKREERRLCLGWEGKRKDGSEGKGSEGRHPLTMIQSGIPLCGPCLAVAWFVIGGAATLRPESKADLIDRKLGAPTAAEVRVGP